jgi:hypothetical protein
MTQLINEDSKDQTSTGYRSVRLSNQVIIQLQARSTKFGSTYNDIVADLLKEVGEIKERSD